MSKFFTLLKYLDRSKITAEAVTEILALAKIHVDHEQAAELANVFKTRGMAGLLPYAPDLMALRDSSSAEDDQTLHICPKCRHIYKEEA